MERPARRTHGRNPNVINDSPIAVGRSFPYSPKGGSNTLQFGILFAICNRRPMPVTKVDGTGKRILVIDDDLAIRVLLQAVLRRMNFDVDLAEDGAAGLEKLQSNGTVDLVLLDLMMPKLNGYEFIDQ